MSSGLVFSSEAASLARGGRGARDASRTFAMNSSRGVAATSDVRARRAAQPVAATRTSTHHAARYGRIGFSMFQTGAVDCKWIRNRDFRVSTSSVLVDAAPALHQIER